VPVARRLSVGLLLAIFVVVAACSVMPAPTPPIEAPLATAVTPFPAAPIAIPATTEVPATASAGIAKPAVAGPTEIPAAAGATTETSVVAGPTVSIPTVTTGVPTSIADRDLVSMALTNLANATSFGMTVTIQAAGVTAAGSGDIIMEVVQKPLRRVHMKVGDQLEMIVIGEDAYMRAGPTAWQKSTMSADRLQQLESSLDFATVPSDLSKVQISKLGSETIGDIETDVFNVAVTDAQAQATRMWISRSGKMVVQQSIEEAGNGIIVSFYGWNTIKIEAPQM
jgi:hypothetical protein